MSRQTFHNPRQPRPCPVPRATWQPDVIAGSENFRVFLNGEPVAGAIAASEYERWVIVSVGRGRSDEDEPDGVVTPYRAGSTKTLEGKIELLESRY